MKQFNIFLFILFSISVNSQTKEQIISKVIEVYTVAKPLQYNTVYNLYKNSKSKVVEESYSGFFSKNDLNDVYLKINNTEFFYNKITTAKISHDEKMIQILDSQSLQQTEYDIKGLLENFQEVKLKDNKNFWELELTAGPFVGLPYSKLIIHIGKDYFIRKQIFYYSASYDFSEDYQKPDLHQPRLEMIYEKPVRNAQRSSLYDTSRFFKINKSIVVLSSKYSSYKIIDQRINKQ